MYTLLESRQKMNLNVSHAFLDNALKTYEALEADWWETGVAEDSEYHPSWVRNLTGQPLSMSLDDGKTYQTVDGDQFTPLHFSDFYSRV